MKTDDCISKTASSSRFPKRKTRHLCVFLTESFSSDTLSNKLRFSGSKLQLRASYLLSKRPLQAARKGRGACLGHDLLKKVIPFVSSG